MIQIVVPVFLVILVGYIFGKKNQFSAESENLLNTYVLYIALPALLFLAVARARPSDLAQGAFVYATLAGIMFAYICGLIMSKLNGVRAPQSSLVGMACCYGTTGYMGIPILIAAFGSQAAVPAAIATILHNIPAIITVIITHDVSSNRVSGLMHSLSRALFISLKNPLVIAVLAGASFSVLHIPVPTTVVNFTQFLSHAAGPTALFALGLGLARMSISKQSLFEKVDWIAPTVTVKIIVQPLVTLAVLLLLTDQKIDMWFITAVIMAAQPIGAGAYVFAKKYEYFNEETSLSIIISLLVTVVTLTVALHVLSGYLMH